MSYNLADPEDWYQQYNAVQRKIQTQLDKFPKTISSLNDRSNIRKLLKKSKEEVADLKSNINILNVSKTDKATRKDQCDELNSLISKLESKLSEKKNVQDLLEKREEKYRNWKPENESSETRGMDNGEILAYQNRVMEQQDQSVDKLISSLNRVKDISKNIGDELDEHTVLLNDLNHETIKVKSNIDRQNRRISSVTKKAGIAIFLIVILILFIIFIIIVLLVMKFFVLG